MSNIILNCCVNNIAANRVAADPPSTPITPPKLCTDGLGICSVKCDINCCSQMCNNDYSGLEPAASCEEVPGGLYSLCICRHHCKI